MRGLSNCSQEITIRQKILYTAIKWSMYDHKTSCPYRIHFHAPLTLTLIHHSYQTKKSQVSLTSIEPICQHKSWLWKGHNFKRLVPSDETDSLIWSWKKRPINNSKHRSRHQFFRLKRRDCCRLRRGAEYNILYTLWDTLYLLGMS